MLEDWSKGITYEIAFWNALYKFRGKREKLFRWSHYGKDIELPGLNVATFIKEREAALGRRPTLLDVGCGLSYCTGNMLQGQPLDLHYVDPLARFYNRIIQRYRVDVPAIEFGMIEFLSCFYKSAEVSLIMVLNALDHCENPMKGIIECLRTLEIDGVLYLKHFPNEAEKESYRGFHQFNICAEDGNMIVWNKQSRYNVNEMLSTFADVTVTASERDVVAVIRKREEVPATMYDDQEDRLYLSEQMFLMADHLCRPSYTFVYQIKGFFYHIVQISMQLFDTQQRQKIKQFLSRRK